MKAVLFKGASQYGVLRGFIDEIAAAFAARGDEPTVLDLTATKSDDDIRDFLLAQRPAALAFSIMVMGNHRGPDGRSVGDVLEAPHVVQYVDYPLQHGERFLDTVRQAAILCVDPSHIGAIDSVFGPGHFAHTGFGPHAGLGEPMPLDAAAFAMRPIPILFTGTWLPPSPPPWTDFPADFKALYAEAAEIALAEEWVPPHVALDRAFRSRGVAPEDQTAEERKITRTLAAHVLAWVRLQRRLAFFEVAAKVGLKLTLFGAGHDGARLPACFDYRGQVEYAEAIGLMRQAKLTLSVTSVFGEGSHERPLTAMLAGSAAASDFSTFFAEAFTPDEIALYRWRHLEEDLTRLRDLSDNTDALFEIARAGQAKAAANHRWANRIDGILAAAEAARKIPTRFAAP